MDEKSLATLEFPRVLAHLEALTAFSASAELARALRPTSDIDLALERQARTSEARRLLVEHPEASIGAAHDVRHKAGLAARGGVLAAEELLELRATLQAGRELARLFEKHAATYPRLAAASAALPPPAGLIEAISRVFSEKGEMLDSASPRLSSLRTELKTAHARLLAKLERLVNDSGSASLLQEAIITVRNGRYVLPVKAENKHRLKGITQDQSASGATLFVEPLAVVELNNAWHELRLAEEEEIRRILAELSALVGTHSRAIQALVRALASLDLAFACARLAEEQHAAAPVLLPFPDGKQPDVLLRFTHARHPLLDPHKVVPIDIALQNGTSALVITGPNTGGKTVTLKTAGLLAPMAQPGLHIPAQSGSQLRMLRDVLADIGDEQSIEQSLSTFSGHITTVVRILAQCGRDTLVLLDELGAGTDPQEGSALARAILAHLLERKTPCLVATHYSELKAFAHTASGAMNASVEFDARTLRPTYRLLMGLPGRSNALAIAQRLGLDEAVICEARRMVDPAELQADDLLDEIHRQREIARQESAAAEEDAREAERLLGELNERLEKIDEERLEVLRQARRDAQRDLDDLRAEMEELRRAARKAAPAQPASQVNRALRKQTAELDEKISQPLQAKPPVREEARPLKTGDRVLLRSLQVEGELLALNESQAEVQVGKMRVRAELTDLARPKTAPAGQKRKTPPPAETHSARQPFFPSPGMELHLRGKRVEEALDELERFLDAAYAAGLPFARIVHGKGSGAVRQAVRGALASHPLVARWEQALDNEGGEGATVVHFKGE